MFLLMTSVSADAELASDYHWKPGFNASAYVSITKLEYDPLGEGVAYLDGTFYVRNLNPKKSCRFDGELRLEILKPLGDNKFETLGHFEQEIEGNLKKNKHPFVNIRTRIQESVNLHMDCLSPRPKEGERYTMSASITLRVTIGGVTETWKINDPTHKIEFRHEPLGVHGLGSTRNGETFAGDCNATLIRELRSWESLVITEDPTGTRPGPYDEVYWYIRAPGDATHTLIEIDHGDGVETHATMEYSFVDEDDELKGKEGFYEITAVVLRWDQSVYWDSYNVWVKKDR